MVFIRVIYANDRKVMAIRANTGKYGSLTEKKQPYGVPGVYGGLGGFSGFLAGGGGGGLGVYGGLGFGGAWGGLGVWVCGSWGSGVGPGVGLRRWERPLLLFGSLFQYGRDIRKASFLVGERAGGFGGLGVWGFARGKGGKSLRRES